MDWVLKAKAINITIINQELFAPYLTLKKVNANAMHNNSIVKKIAKQFCDIVNELNLNSM